MPSIIQRPYFNVTWDGMLSACWNNNLGCAKMGLISADITAYRTRQVAEDLPWCENQNARILGHKKLPLAT